MQKSSYEKKVLLYSGGMDSWLIDKIWKPDVKLYVDMGTKYSQEEIKRLPADVVVEKLDLSKWERGDKIIPLRNMYLIGIATNYGNEICLGATAGDRVLDKSPVFADIYEQLLNYLYQKQHWTEERKIKINLDGIGQHSQSHRAGGKGRGGGEYAVHKGRNLVGKHGLFQHAP